MEGSLKVITFYDNKIQPCRLYFIVIRFKAIASYIVPFMVGLCSVNFSVYALNFTKHSFCTDSTKCKKVIFSTERCRIWNSFQPVGPLHSSGPLNCITDTFKVNNCSEYFRAIVRIQIMFICLQCQLYQFGSPWEKMSFYIVK